ncbi:hypothetical protein BJ912DRAFT_1055169 [Pholiota molesta]|nr:hypothetical protein BJ912DRAFT_1055169 [Pholiota molesta]
MPPVSYSILVAGRDIGLSTPRLHGEAMPQQRLPFTDNSFDLVRMSCLALCITSDSWVFLLQEASSALDLSAPHSPTQSIPPKLDITIPSPSFTTFSIYDEQVTNPGLGLPISGDEDGMMKTSSLTYTKSRTTSRQPRSRASSPVISQRSWNRAQATSGDLEALFDHMLGHKFGIRKDLNDFILDLLKDVFGHAREMRTMHLALAPPETELEAGI